LEILPTFKPEPHKPHPGQNLQWVADPHQGLRWISKKIDPRALPRKTLSFIIEIHSFAFNTSCKTLWLRTISRLTNAAQHGIYPEPNTGLFLLKRAKCANGKEAGDIIPIDQLRSFVDIAPRFGEKADPRFTNSSSLTYATEFWLNKYFDKELFYALS